MTSVIFGVIVLILGVWGIIDNWYAFVDFVCVFVPLVMVVGGAIALMAGIYSFSVKDSSNITFTNK
ncbi:MAG: hypothetical protein HQM16_10115 [Deltaproteobacteria bacterium]|nr:hypothetical protein [Deltaproteobacteria bacterium]